MSNDDQLVDIDEGENWTVTFRTNKLEEMGWQGTFPEWRQAMELLGANPLELDPPAKSLAEARERAEVDANALEDNDGSGSSQAEATYEALDDA